MTNTKGNTKPFKPSGLDNFIGLFSQSAKENRIRSKFKIKKMIRKYEGAGRGPRLENWNTNSGSANSIIGGSLRILRDRARDLRINNEHGASGVNVITSHLVGSGIKTKFNSISNLTDEANLSRAKVFNDLWKQWAGTPNCDFAGRHNLAGLQRIVADAIVETGEVIIRFRRVQPTFSNPLGLQLQILEADHLESNFIRTKRDNGNFLLQGIEFDENGRRVAYHLFDRHPGGPSSFGETNLRTTIINQADIMHPYREDRPGQQRGVTWFAPILVKTRDYAEYEDAVLVRQKIANCFAVFVTDLDGDDDSTESEQDKKDDEFDGVIAPGSKVNLPAGKDISFATPPGVELSHRDYSSVSLHAIAAGLSVPYELLTKDVSQTNYSSIRTALNSFMKTIKGYRSDFFYPQFLDPIATEFLRHALLIGLDPSGITFEHKPPAVQILDPTKEVPALRLEVRSGFKPWSTAVTEMGEDPDEVLAQFKIDNANFDKLGLIFDSDARKVQSNGKLQMDEISGDDVPDNGNETNTDNTRERLH